VKCYNFDDIVLYVDNALSNEAKKDLEDHIKICEDCKKMFDTLMSTGSFLISEVTADKNIDNKVLNTIDKGRYTDKKNKIKGFRYLYLLKNTLKPVAAIILICMVLLYLGYGRYITDNLQSGTKVPNDNPQTVNILLLGNDIYKNTDAIILINYDLINAQMNLLSIPRVSISMELKPGLAMFIMKVDPVLFQKQ